MPAAMGPAQRTPGGALPRPPPARLRLDPRGGPGGATRWRTESAGRDPPGWREELARGRATLRIVPEAD